MSFSAQELNPWRELLRGDELSALEETERVLLRPPPVRTGVLRWAEQKATAAAEKLPEGVRSSITGAVSGALEKIQTGSAWLISEAVVRKRLERELGPLRAPEQLLRAHLPTLDGLAREYMGRATTGLTLEGAAAGAAGWVGLAADIPILYSVLFKTIQEVAVCYGFRVAGEGEKLHVLQTLDVGHNFNAAARPELAARLFRLQGLMRTDAPLSAMQAIVDAEDETGSGFGAEKQALVRQLRLARQLAFDLLERKLLQGLVLVGSVIGAASNYQLTRDVGLAAFHLYRRRHLLERALRRVES